MLFSILFLSSSIASYAADLPSRETAGAEQQRFDERSEEKRRELERPMTETPEITETETVSERKESARFILKAVTFEGNESVSTPALESIASDWIGKTVSLEDLKAIASKIKQYYRERGFVAAYVYIPRQDVSSGIVKFAVTEGLLGSIRFEGNRWYSSQALRSAFDMQEGKAVSTDKLSSGLSYLNKNQDIKARALLKPGEEPKTTDVLVRVEDQLPLHLDAGINNTGTKNTGETRGVFGASYNNLTGHMDQLSSRYQVGSYSWAVGGQYLLPIEPNKTDLSLSYSKSAVDLGGDFEALDVKGDASTYGVDVKRKVWMNAFNDLFLNVGFDWKSVENSVLGVDAGNDELRILNAGINLEQKDAWGATYFPNTFHFGLGNVFGGSEKLDQRATRTGTGGQFFIYRSSVARFQRLPHGMSILLRGSLQLTPDRLPPSEQFHLGGAFSVRGYQESEYLSDYGGFGSIELSIPSYFFPEDWKLPFSSESLRTQIQEIVFFDAGTGSLRRTATGERDTRTLAGYGAGFKIHLYDRIYGRVQWADAILSKSSDGSSDAFYYGISAELLG